jgi:hypothetical protein
VTRARSEGDMANLYKEKRYKRKKPTNRWLKKRVSGCGALLLRGSVGGGLMMAPRAQTGDYKKGVEDMYLSPGVRLRACA